MTRMNKIKTVCVYCGSGSGNNGRFIEAASAFGKILAESGIRLVYGGGSTGLMGAIANGVLDHGGGVTGIIPEFLNTRERMLTRVQELIVTPDMHERKRLMFERSDASVRSPAASERWKSSSSIDLAAARPHSKPVLLANIDGFWEPLLALLTHMRATQFIRPGFPVEVLKAERVEDILPRLRAAAALNLKKRCSGAGSRAPARQTLDGGRREHSSCGAPARNRRHPIGFAAIFDSLHANSEYGTDLRAVNFIVTSVCTEAALR